MSSSIKDVDTRIDELEKTVVELTKKLEAMGKVQQNLIDHVGTYNEHIKKLHR